MTEVSKFDDARVQVVYDILCSYAQPPADEHWEGFTARRIADALAAPTTKAESAHPDDIAVDALATAMKFKLAKQRSKGYGGWDTDCTQQRLSDLLRGHVAKGDPVDVANFCAFLVARGEGIQAEVQPKTAELPKGVAQFTKKPVTINAIQWDGKNLYEVISFTQGVPNTRSERAQDAWDDYAKIVEREGLHIDTLEGKMLANVGDWIIRGVKGEHYPCKPDIFAATYEPATAPQAEVQAEPLRWMPLPQPPKEFKK